MDVKQPPLEALKLLVEVSQMLTVLELDRVLQQVIDLAAKAVGASKASLFLQEGPQVDWDHLFTMRDLSPDDTVQVVGRVLDEGFAGWVFRHKQGDIITDTTTDDRWIVFADDTTPVRSVLGVPFLHNDNVIAILTLVHPQPHHFTEYHLRLMTIVANQFTIAIRNAQLFHRIRAQQRELQTVLQSITDVLLVLDIEGRIKILNQAAVPLLDVDFQGDVIDFPLQNFLHVDPPVFKPIVNVLNGKDPSATNTWSFEVRSERRQQDFQVKISVWEDILDSAAGYVVVMHDVTTLRDLHRFKDQMLRVASHDLRSPLALITGYVDMIELDTPDAESPVHNYVEVIKRTTERMGGLLDDVLRVERIRSSPLELHEQTDLEQLVKVVLVNMRPLAFSKRQRFDTDVQLRDIPRIVADPVLLRQSMENLISNAIKYTPESGTITISAFYNDERFEFSVEDTGMGIPEEHLPYLFESFYRVDYISVQKGSGLGLSLVKNVIQRHHGEVWVRSKPGTGSQFGFWLPLS